MDFPSLSIDSIMEQQAVCQASREVWSAPGENYDSNDHHNNDNNDYHNNGNNVDRDNDNNDDNNMNDDNNKNNGSDANQRLKNKKHCDVSGLNNCNQNIILFQKLQCCNT